MRISSAVLVQTKRWERSFQPSTNGPDLGVEVPEGLNHPGADQRLGETRDASLCYKAADPGHRAGHPVVRPAWPGCCARQWRRPWLRSARGPAKARGWCLDHPVADLGEALSKHGPVRTGALGGDEDTLEVTLGAPSDPLASPADASGRRGSSKAPAASRMP